MEFLPKILPKVYRTEGDMVDFDPSKIFESIVKETGMDEKNANKITELTTRRIISSGIKFLSGPHIREIVCSILSEQHFEKERKLYTRIGMPLMDYEEILEHPPEKLGAFPESVHQIAANQLSLEYTHLRILSEEESKAHLYGDIYIHGLENFELKPTNQYWDPRLILKNGLPPLKNYRNGCRHAPARTIEEAILHLTKWLAMTFHEFNGIQGYLFLNDFLAPYIRGLDDEHVKRTMKLLIHELNQLNLTTGRRLPITFISTYPGIVSSLEKLPAIGPKGEEKGILGDFSEEGLKLYNIIVDLFKKGCIEKKPLVTPRHFIYLDDHVVKQENDHGFFQTTWEESLGPNIPIFINLRGGQLQELKEEFKNPQKFYNHGILQKITLNLPRYAYLSRNEDEFREILREKMELSLGILKKKKELIQKRLLNRQLPLCSSEHEQNEKIYNLEDQILGIGFIGLNETVKILIGEELHESENAFELGLKIVREIKKYCTEYSTIRSMNLALFDCNSQKVTSRFTNLDLKHFSDKIQLPLNGITRVYSQSSKFNEEVETELLTWIKKQGQFHELINREVMEYFPKKFIEGSIEEFKKFALVSLKESKLGAYTFRF